MRTIYIENNTLIGATKNTGAPAKQELHKATINYALTTEAFEFADIAAAKNQTIWDAAKAAKDIAIMFSVEGSELANAEATYYESRTLKIATKEARKGIKFKHHLDLYSHSALKSYADSGYTRIIEFTEDGKIKCVLENGKIKGQKMSEFIVGLLTEPVIGGDPGSTTAEVVYSNYEDFEDNGHLLIPDFDVEDYEGIYDVALTVESASATEIILTATTLQGANVTNLVLANWKETSGTINASSYDAGTGKYTLTGTAFVTGTIATDGVIEQTNIMYEAEPVVLTVV